jgi:hypothetical protein
VVTLRLEGETRIAAGEGPRHHGLEMRLLRKATYDLNDERFRTFEMVAVGSRRGGTKNNSRQGDADEGPIAILSMLAGTALVNGCHRRSLSTGCIARLSRGNDGGMAGASHTIRDGPMGNAGALCDASSIAAGRWE